MREDSTGAPAEIDRRTVLKIMGTSLAAVAGLHGCVRKPHRDAVSRESEPEYRRPGVALHYATTWTEGWFPYGMLVKTLEGRPVKIEGNPDHPVNAGTTNAAMQATLLSLYDPSRMRQPKGPGGPISWAGADSRIREALSKASSIVLLTRATLGPSEREVRERFLKKYPAARALAYEPMGDRERRAAWREVYGRDGEWIPRLDRARVIVSTGSDFLAGDGAELEAIRALSGARDVHESGGQGKPPPRLYCAEGVLSLTGTNADHRIRIRPSDALAFVKGMRAALKDGAAAGGSIAGAGGAVFKALVEDLSASRGAALVLAGARYPQAVHAAVALVNDDLGAPGATLQWNPRPPGLIPDSRDEISRAVSAGVDVIILLGVDPVYDWPEFASMLSRARLSVAHAQYTNPTVGACSIGLPSHHNLESWNDAAPRPGLTCFCQPVVQPLFDTRQEAESLMVWTEAPRGGTPRHTLFRDLLRARAMAGPLAGEPGPTAAWERALQRGVVVVEAPPEAAPVLDRAKAEAMCRVQPSAISHQPSAGDPLELVLIPHAGAHDGRFAANPWLVEAPDPVTKLMWDNGALIGASAAAALKLETGDVVAVKSGESAVELPVLVVPGMAEGTVAVAPGMGRPTFLDPASPAGVNAWALSRDGMMIQRDVSISKTGRRRIPVTSQTAWSMEGRPIVLSATVAEFAADPEVISKKRRRPPDSRAYPAVDYSKGRKWVMTIDLNRCIGCNACVIACQAENNIPSVGRDQCANGREMHWIRIDQYREGQGDELRVHHQPMPCQQCDNAPCENVCPVNATNHSPEGLNDMVYNRCIGTRYCANNCPYKVRRFNFYNFQKRAIKDPVQKLLHNPNVTVRQVGVMEKCSFCVQRINAAKFAAANAGRPVRDGEIMPACAQACPAQAIAFGDAQGAGNRVAELRRSKRAFLVLEDVLTEPAVTYLAGLRNAGRTG